MPNYRPICAIIIVMALTAAKYKSVHLVMIPTQLLPTPLIP
ncbi:hypothetical protein SOVF_157550 [Spinacia oleracea]|nr:hypothetical protein SOVF_157550 [Spinacia oleracea]